MIGDLEEKLRKQLDFKDDPFCIFNHLFTGLSKILAVTGYCPAVYCKHCLEVDPDKVFFLFVVFVFVVVVVVFS